MPQGFFLDHYSAEEVNNSSTIFWVKIPRAFCQKSGMQLLPQTKTPQKTSLETNGLVLIK